MMLTAAFCGGTACAHASAVIDAFLERGRR
jgi:hypothetical protein